MLTQFELKIMSAIYACGTDEFTIGMIHKELDRYYAYTTIQTMITRLKLKGYIEKVSTGKPANYKTVMSKLDLYKRQVDVIYRVLRINLPN